MARVVAPDADDLYRIAGVILATPGVERTDTALVMRRLVIYRLQPLLQRLVEDTPQDELLASPAVETAGHPGVVRFCRGARGIGVRR
jgi:hypothetical protein